jgi:tetratricopeptide (TPR) repeat protein
MVLTFRTHVRITSSLLQGMAVQAVVMLIVALVPLAAHAGTTASAQECEGFVARSKELLANTPDSALALARRAEQCMGLLPSAERQATVLIALGDAYLATGEKPAALGVYQRAQLLVEDALEKEGSRPALVLARSDIRMKIGALHFYLRDWEKSIADYNEAMRILDETPEGIADDELARRKVRLFNNMAGVHIQLQDHGTALPYFEQALVLNRPLKDARNESSLNNNIGICHMEMGRYDLADQYFLKALAVRKEVGDVRGQAQVLNNLGKNQAKVGHFAAARGHYQQALSLGRAAGSRESVVITLESLAMVLDTLGEHKAALLTYRAFKALNDSLYSTETRTTIARLEEEFRRDKEKKVLELEAERKDAEAARQRTWNVALIGALFFLLLTAFLLFKVMRARVRNGLLEQEKLRLEHEKLEAEQVALRENLESRERELTANALFLLKKNELIAHIAERLLKAKSTFKQENQPIIQEIVRDLQASEDDHNWKEFEVHFTRVHSTFYQTLQERFPSLTPNERKLCAFLRLNMSTKDISAITQQSLNSITVARSRLRKKLQIEGEEVNLVDFLQAI